VPVNHVLAGIAVADVDSAVGWFERLFGRPADARPMDGLAEWHFGECGVVQLIEDGDRAGRSLLTLAVDDLQAELSALGERGVEASAMDDKTSDKVRFAPLTDPEGNVVTLVD
jgi:hypothetical protein